MSILYVASDRQAAGKTAVCGGLARCIARRGKRVSVFKPIVDAAGGDEVDHDAEAYRSLLGVEPEGWPVDSSGPVPDAGLLGQMASMAQAASSNSDVAIAEGSNALSVEGVARAADAMDASVVVVAGYRRDLSVTELAPWRDALGDRLVGFVINGVTRYAGTETRQGLLADMAAQSMGVLGTVPEDRCLMGVRVSQLAEHLNGRFLTGEDLEDGLVENVLVGGMGMDSGALYFGIRDRKAVVVRGDRPDVQMAALATPTACLVLTKGIEPIEYVRYEAEQEGVPLVIVDTDTLATMGAVDHLVDRARFDHQLKLQRAEELLEEHLDLASLYRELGIGG